MCCCPLQPPRSWCIRHYHPAQPRLPDPLTQMTQARQSELIEFLTDCKSALNKMSTINAIACIGATYFTQFRADPPPDEDTRIIIGAVYGQSTLVRALATMKQELLTSLGNQHLTPLEKMMLVESHVDWLWHSYELPLPGENFDNGYANRIAQMLKEKIRTTPRASQPVPVVAPSCFLRCYGRHFT